MAEKKELTPEEVKAIQEENKRLANELKSANEIIAKNANIINELNEKLNTVSANVDGLNEAISAKDGLINDLNEQLVSQEKENEALAKYPVLSHKGKKYELIDKKSRARFEGKNVFITAEALKEDSKLLDHCIKKGYSCLREKGGK